MISVTRMTASTIVVNTFLIERSMKTVESKPTSTLVALRQGLVHARQHGIDGIGHIQRLATACLTMPMEMDVAPA